MSKPNLNSALISFPPWSLSSKLKAVPDAQLNFALMIKSSLSVPRISEVTLYPRRSICFHRCSSAELRMRTRWPALREKSDYLIEADLERHGYNDGCPPAPAFPKLREGPAGPRTHPAVPRLIPEGHVGDQRKQEAPEKHRSAGTKAPQSTWSGRTCIPRTAPKHREPRGAMAEQNAQGAQPPPEPRGDATKRGRPCPTGVRFWPTIRLWPSGAAHNPAGRRR